jgi:5-methylcytosine-specific restriction endonuclease McrA
MSHSEKCRHCGDQGPHTVDLTTSGVHHAKVTCGGCNRFLRWLPKPESDPTKYRRPTSHTNLVADYGQGYCEMCLRKKEDLPPKQTLEAQHVLEFKDGGSNERENIWIVCTACHRMIHWIRTYHGSYKVSHVLALVEAELPSE